MSSNSFPHICHRKGKNKQLLRFQYVQSVFLTFVTENKTKTVQVLSESLFLEGPVIGALNTTKNVTGVALTLSDLRRLTHNMSCFASVVRKMRRVKPTV